MKCLEIARLQDFAPNTQGLRGALSGPQTPCRIERTPTENFYGPECDATLRMFIFDYSICNMNARARLPWQWVGGDQTRPVSASGPFEPSGGCDTEERRKDCPQSL